MKVEESPIRKNFSVKLVLRTVVHFVCTLLFCSVNIYILVAMLMMKKELVDNPEIKGLMNFAPLFFTNWNFLFQIIFLTLSLVYDILEWLNKHEMRLALKLRYCRDVIFSGMVVPYTLFVSIMFWTLFLIDRELVFPKVYDVILPWWYNHCVHTNIVIVILIETLIQARRHPTDQKVELILDGAVGILYAIVYYSVYLFAQRWLYPVFAIFNWWQVCLFQLLIWASCFVFYFIQFPINRIFHKEENNQNVPVPTKELDDVNGIPGDHKNGFHKNGNVDAEVSSDSKKISRNLIDNSKL